MEIRQLEYFLTVAKYLNFSRAAESLYISQPALSHQIAELEKELGTELFIRDRRKVYLTTAGSALIQPARETLEASGRLMQLAKNSFLPDCIATLRIGFDDTEDHYEFTGITETLASFAQNDPAIRLEMTKGRFTDCADQVIYGDLDAAFLILRHKEHLPPDLAAVPVHEARIVMVVREDCPAANCSEAIAMQDVILVGEKPRGNSRILYFLESMHLTPRIRRVDSMPAGFTYCQMGQGIMLLTDLYYNHHDYKGLKAISVPGEAAKITHSLVWNRHTTNSVVLALVDLFRTVSLPDAPAVSEAPEKGSY